MPRPVPAAPRRVSCASAAAVVAALLVLPFAAVPAFAQADPAPAANVDTESSGAGAVPDEIEVSPALSGITPPADGPAADGAVPEATVATPPQTAPAASAPAAEASSPTPAGESAAGDEPTSDTASASEEAAHAATTPPDPATIPTRELVLVTGSGLHRFTIEIADDPVERSRGLMFRTEMAADHGMLFDFGAEGPRSFWMKNTPLPLDIIFVAADGRVVSVARNTTPYSTDSIPSEGDARFVFEVNAGVADEIGLAPGDTLLHRRIVR